MFEIITPLSYWVLMVLWLIILVLYLTKLKQSKAAGGAVAILLTILAIDAFRTVFESAYFGLYFNSLFGLLPKGVHDVLSRPAILIIPKLINVVAGLLVLFLLIRRWVPREIREREEWITALQESEERVRNLLNSTAEAIYGLDLNGHCTFCNPACIEILGYEREDELLGQNMHNLIHHTRPGGERYPAEECLIYKAFQDGKGIHNDAEVLWRKDKSSFPAEYWSYPLHRGGRLIGSVVTFLDITERRALEEKLRQSQKMEAVGQLAAGIAHDFNNLMGVMIGNVEILQDQFGEDETARRNFEAIVRSVKRGASLTEQLLAFSRQQVLSPQPTIINDLILDLEDMLHRTLGETVELRSNLRSATSTALIDPHQFENALINLAINARDAMPKGGVLTIETADVTLDEDHAAQYEDVMPGDYVKVTVSDTGTGMSPETQERALEPFFTTKGVGEGSGLGLSMVYGFARQSDGHVTIISQAGRGTTIDLYLPQTEEIVALEDTKDGTPKPAWGSERILIVEDDEDLREIPRSMLRDQGYDVVDAGNGEEAIKHLQSGQRFDLLFTDVVLPGGMNGVEIANEAERIQPGIKILFTSGYAENTVAHNGKFDQVTSLINKPYRRNTLLEKVRAVLDGADN